MAACPSNHQLQVSTQLFRPMRVLYFGVARDLAGIDSDELPVAHRLSVEQLWTALLELHPRLADCKAICRLAADMEYLGDADVLSASTGELAIIPPVAGG